MGLMSAYGATHRRTILREATKKILAFGRRRNVSNANTGVNRHRASDGRARAGSNAAGSELKSVHTKRLSHHVAALLCRLPQRSKPVCWTQFGAVGFRQARREWRNLGEARSQAARASNAASRHATA